MSPIRLVYPIFYRGVSNVEDLTTIGLVETEEFRTLYANEKYKQNSDVSGEESREVWKRRSFVCIVQDLYPRPTYIKVDFHSEEFSAERKCCKM